MTTFSSTNNKFTEGQWHSGEKLTDQREEAYHDPKNFFLREK